MRRKALCKVVVDADTHEILGAAILGVGGDEAIHCILDVMSAKAPYTTLSRTMHIHPTVCELIPTMLQEMSPLRLRRPDQAARLGSRCATAFGPG